MTTRKRNFGERGKVIWLQGTLDDISTANAEDAIYVPETGVITEVHTVLQGAITTGDAVITPVYNGTAFASGNTITVANGSSAQGDIDSITGDEESVVAGNYVGIKTDGGSTNAVELKYMLKLVVRDGAVK